MILNGSMTQGWMAPSLPFTSLGDALIFEDFCVSSCPGAEWSKQWVLGTLLGSCSPFACYILLWFYEIALPLSYLSTRSSLLVDFSGFFKFRMCSSFTFYRLVTFVSPPPALPQTFLLRPYRGVHKLTWTRLNRARWPEQGSLVWHPTWGIQLLGEFLLFFWIWLLDVWVCLVDFWIHLDFLADVSSFYWIHGWMLTLSVVFVVLPPWTFGVIILLDWMKLQKKNGGSMILSWILHAFPWLFPDFFHSSWFS